MTDSPYTPIPRKLMYPAFQFFTFLGLFLLVYIICNILGVLVVMAIFGTSTLMNIAHLNVSAQNLNALWTIQFISVTLPIFLSPIIFSYRIVRDPANYLKTNFNFSWLVILVVFLTMLLCLPLLEFLGDINAKMVLPKFLKGLQKWMRESEDSAKKVSDTMMQMKTIWNMLFTLFFIGLLTAIVEELMFRGCLQTILLKWMKNKHVAIWITAILFSAFHMEFFGFLPRLMLGLFFGYFVAWSGSIWPAIWAHFVNNGTVVVITYLFQHKLINLNPDNQQVFNYAGYIISFVITLLLLFAYRYISMKRKIADIDGEELG
ncbi:MAG: family intrarane metalloprotease [Mucilaginibacter sp.]|nr:family intrarane metalloprotease [Mucilaginibacter sp.]